MDTTLLDEVLREGSPPLNERNSESARPSRPVGHRPVMPLNPSFFSK